ncbi:MAG: hypothetical protein V4813_18985 [Gemmatimonadota bacterium]
MTQNARTGVTLVELLVSLVLLLALLAISGASMQRLLAVQSRTGAGDARSRATSDALQTVRRHAGTIDVGNGDLLVARDTALELVRTVGVTTTCRSSGDTLVVTSGADTLPWSSTLPRAISTDDAVRLWHETDARWVSRRVLGALPASGPCGDGGAPWPDVASQALVLDSMPSGVRPGAAVRVVQRERWSLVRGGDGRWSLALASWNAARTTFDTPQPLLSPLSAPSATGGPGLVVRALNAQGAVVADSALRSAVALVVMLRGLPASRDAAPFDSVRIHVGAH